MGIRKLNEAQINEISDVFRKDIDHPVLKLARDYGVHQNIIRKIKERILIAKIKQKKGRIGCFYQKTEYYTEKELLNLNYEYSVEDLEGDEKSLLALKLPDDWAIKTNKT